MLYKQVKLALFLISTPFSKSKSLVFLILFSCFSQELSLQSFYHFHSFAYCSISSPTRYFTPIKLISPSPSECFFYKLFLLFYQSFLDIFSVVFQSCIIPDLSFIHMLIVLSIFSNSIFYFFNSIFSLEASPCFLNSCLTFPFLHKYK